MNAGHVTVVGVRHHSPACAKLVREVIERVRPRYVLIEGPSDMNDRMDEFGSAHRLPIALFSYCQDASTGFSRGLWTPFCDYSPEWVAMQSARSVDATPLFIDLPAWEKAFADEENRYSDRQTRASDRLGQMSALLGFEGTDALWDHLFEGPPGEALSVGPAKLEPRLAAYFEALRGDEAAETGDTARENFMARFIAWAAGQGNGGAVVVVCGGYHKVALERLWPTMGVPDQRPFIARPEGMRVGSYLVRFSFKRLDSFQGYASGMPSPAFYQRVWETGDPGEDMLFEAVRRLRARGLTVSVADAIAARTLSFGLASIRGREALRRIDVLDGLAGALIKHSLEVPLPWTQRGPLPLRTDPLLVELVSIFSGEVVGELAPGTPRPPLVDDALSELKRVGIPFGGAAPARFRLALTSPAGLEQSHVLHRFRVLGIPGFTLTRGPSFSRQQTDLTEEWTLNYLLETDPALVEAAVFGGQLLTAACGRLEEQTRGSSGLAALALALTDGVFAGLTALTTRWLSTIGELVATESSLAELGQGLMRLLTLARGEGLVAAPVAGFVADLLQVIVACYDRGLWLFEGITGPTATFDVGDVDAVRALRDAARHPLGGEILDVARGRAVCERRAVDAGAPPALRGAALGFLWSVPEAIEGGRDTAEPGLAVLALRGASQPETVGDFLAGLFALARGELLAEDRTLLQAIDDLVTGLTELEFFVALPAMRQAFAYFPPRERLSIAEGVVASKDESHTVDPMTLLDAEVRVEVVLRGRALEQRALALRVRFGLGGPEA